MRLRKVVISHLGHVLRGVQAVLRCLVVLGVWDQFRVCLALVVRKRPRHRSFQGGDYFLPVETFDRHFDDLGRSDKMRLIVCDAI